MVKLTIEFVKEQFELKGYTLLSDQYANAHQKLNYICPQGHRHSMNWNNWKQGQHCPACVGKIVKRSIKEIKAIFANRGYKCLDTEYLDGLQKLNYICPEGHKSSMNSSNFLRGRKCPICSMKNRLQKRRKDINEVRQFFEKAGYELLTENYVNSNTKLKYLCPKRHENSMTWDNFRAGYRCPTCQRKVLGERTRRNWKNPEFQKKIYKSFNLKPNKPETALFNLLNQLFPNEYKYVGDFQFFLGGKNPDFLNVNSQKKLIEIFGIHWHSPKMTGLSREKHECERVAHFKKFSFDTLIIWENELKDQETLTTKLQEFHNKNFEHRRIR